MRVKLRPYTAWNTNNHYFKCKRARSNYDTHKRTMRCSCSVDQHDIRSIHSTNHPTNINVESSSPSIVLFLDSKIAHESERDRNFKHSCRQQATNANVRCADRLAQHHTRSFQPYSQRKNESTNESTNEWTNKDTKEVSLIFIVVYLDSKKERIRVSEITTSGTQTGSNECKRTMRCLFRTKPHPAVPAIYSSNKQTNERTNERTNKRTNERRFTHCHCSIKRIQKAK